QTSKVPAAVYNTNDCQSCVVVAIGDNLRENRPKAIRGIFHVGADVPFAWPFNQTWNGGVQFLRDMIGGIYAVARNRMPDLEQVEARLGSDQQSSHPALLLLLSRSSRSSR